MRKGMGLRLAVPQQESNLSTWMTNSGTWREGDVLVSRDGLNVTQPGENNPQPGPRPQRHHHEHHDRSHPDEGETTVSSLQDLEPVQVLGRGSSGLVQKVQHRRTGRLFAVKEIQMNVQEQVRTQIMRELRILYKSYNRNVVQCFNAFHSNGVISIVLEYMDGGSLADVVRAVRRIPELYIAAITRQVLHGLWYLHKEVHIIHRDIKPSNLLVNLQGDVKISDFGVSVVLANSMGQCASFVGTCTYMSPERINGGTYGYDCDIWSLGLSLMECALGRFPYQPPGNELGWGNFFDLLHTIVEQPPPTLPEDQFSPEFCDFITACLRKNPKERPSAGELLSHPFLKKYEGQNVNISRLLQTSA
eukprot:TRINITY_DN2202_c0_g1_i1.p1 TRINITY_DN2202_c0_g1~~TRINITY_DN2202_c0_g1_i1.p1  ORF type:complete len:361 (-),score=51.76 TRINITY_DN2202_c0_g1_i1:719-1801(-)